jgi:hypothetical protein
MNNQDTSSLNKIDLSLNQYKGTLSSNGEYFIELDKYLDLSEWELVQEEFKNSFHKVPTCDIKNGSIHPTWHEPVNKKDIDDEKVILDDLSPTEKVLNRQQDCIIDSPDFTFDQSNKLTKNKVFLLKDIMTLEEFKESDPENKYENNYWNGGQASISSSGEEFDGKFISQCWKDSPNYDYFPKLKRAISKMPFKEIARIFVVFSEYGDETIAHISHDGPARFEFIWLNLFGDKKMFVGNETQTFDWYKNGLCEEKIIKSYLDESDDSAMLLKGISCWFDGSKIHGTKSGDGLSASVRIDGEFTPEFREKVFKDSRPAGDALPESQDVHTVVNATLKTILALHENRNKYY